MNTAQKLLIENHLLDETFTDNESYMFYLNNNSQDLMDSFTHYKDHIATLRAKLKQQLRAIDQLDIKGDMQ